MGEYYRGKKDVKELQQALGTRKRTGEFLLEKGSASRKDLCVCYAVVCIFFFNFSFRCLLKLYD